MGWPRNVWLVVAAVLAVVVIWMAVPHWRPLVQLERRQGAFLNAIEDRKARRIDALVARDYEDQWGLNRDGLIRASDDLRRYFLVLELEPVEPRVESAGNSGTYTARIRVQGSPLGPGTLIRSEANRVEAPFVFTWKRTGPFPWQWALWRIGNEGLPSLHGYDPALGLELLDIP